MHRGRARPEAQGMHRVQARRHTVALRTQRGLSQLAFSGRIGAHALAVGTHRMTIIATDAAGNRSKPTVLMFSITR